MSAANMAADRPTMYFIGVSTSKSSIMKVFPLWAEYLGIPHAQLKGIDFPLGAEPAAYRSAVQFIKRDPLSQGALITTHKLDLFAACLDLFNETDPHAQRLGETSCLSKLEGKLIAHAKDPISAGLALNGFLPSKYWEKTGAEVFLIGAGGASIATSWHLMCNEGDEGSRPSRILISDRQPSRLVEMRHRHAGFGSSVPVDYLAITCADENDAILPGLKPGSLVVNATGLGKDAPGSPLSDQAVFPEKGIVWEFNYRGDLVFLRQARAQKEKLGLQVEDGWTYFIHGWTRAIAEVFHLEIPISGQRFDRLCEIAAVAGSLEAAK
ncbi:MAG: shikimate dehydrogenase [Verrucomicrobia bacterium]|nr:shikimate dehydrogenase [Verrucomicrobiota bacterium]MBV9671880.1 shikimate dehydrogenase [Verrucomicrobiota bacterium]